MDQQPQDLRLDEHVEGGDGLVQHDDLGSQRQGPGDGHALALAAGELIGVAPHDRARQGDHVEQLGDALVALLAAAHVVHPQRLLNDPVDGVHRVQRAVGVLEDGLHDAPQVEELLAPQGRQVDAVVEDLALGGVQEIEDHIGHRGLVQRHEGLARICLRAHGCFAGGGHQAFSAA